MADIVDRLRSDLVFFAIRKQLQVLTDEAANEIERLTKYETIVKRIAWDYIELSHDKAYNQRDEYIKWCRTTIQEDKDRHD